MKDCMKDCLKRRMKEGDGMKGAPAGKAVPFRPQSLWQFAKGDGRFEKGDCRGQLVQGYPQS